MVEDSFYALVPRDLRGNLGYRLAVHRSALADVGVRRNVWIACSRSLLYWVSVFVWTDDPRLDHPEVPFIPYPFQVEGLSKIESCIGRTDAILLKSRDVGASWVFLLVFLWRWLFRRQQSFLLISRNEDYVDKTGNRKALFQKLDYVLSRLPGWMKPPTHRTAMHLQNLRTDGVIDGESTTGDAGRGDRRTAVLLDELSSFDVADGFRALASTQNVTKSRFFNSTPRGIGNAFAELWHMPVNPLLPGIERMEWGWEHHPVQRAGLYTTKDGKLEVLDRQYDWSKHAGGYPFILDGKLRSPYYDAECARTPLKHMIAQELDRSFLGSGSPFFSVDEIRTVRARDVEDAWHCGEIVPSEEGRVAQAFTARKGGRLHLWMNPTPRGYPPENTTYVMGADISMGREASNSCLSVVDCRTKRKVAEFTVNTLSPERFANYCAALGRWFKGSDGQDAFLIFEANGGPGLSFWSKINESGYTNVYYRRNEKQVRGKVLKEAGWHNSPEGKKALLEAYGNALISGEFVNPSGAAVDECLEYHYVEGGRVEHVRSIHSVDPAGARENHGDRVIADALAYKGMCEFVVQREANDPQPEWGSFQWRAERFEDGRSSLEREWATSDRY